jgi:hypothetical protein
MARNWKMPLRLTKFCSESIFKNQLSNRTVRLRLSQVWAWFLQGW